MSFEKKIGTVKGSAVTPRSRLEQAEKKPYHGQPAYTAAERIALAVMAELGDRHAIAETLQAVDMPQRREIVGSIKRIIEQGTQEESPVR